MLPREAREVLRVLVAHLSQVIPDDMGTFPRYGKVHNELGLQQAGETIGQSLQIQGLESLGRWAMQEGLPAIDAIVVDKDSLLPGKGFWRLHDKSDEDFQWLIAQITQAKEFDWTSYLEDEEPANVQAREVSILLSWLQARAAENDGVIMPFTTQEALSVLGKTDIKRYARAHGNVQSLIDFACFRCGFPPLGLTSSSAFEKAWSDEGRDWSYPIGEMRAAAQARRWNVEDFNQIRATLKVLPGQAWMLWQAIAGAEEQDLRDWAHSFGDRELTHKEGEIELAIQELLGKPRSRGGIAPGLTSAQRKAIEDRAMLVAKEALTREHWKWEDTSKGHPYDLLAERGEIKMYVEVKGTTTAGERVVLTRGEVNHHRRNKAESALYVVSGIELGGTKEAPEARGGLLRSLSPWSIDDADLEPLAFEYSVPISN